MKFKSNNLLIYKSIEPSHFPIIYSAIMSVVILNLLYLFIGPFMNIASKSHLSVNKFNIFHFSEYLYRSNVFIKLLIIISLVIFTSMSFNIFCLIRQRLSVPEFQKYKTKNKLFFALSYVIVFNELLLVFFYYPTIDLSESNLGLCDNIVFFLFLISSYFYCDISIFLICKINIINKSHNWSYLKYKKNVVFALSGLLVTCKSLI